MKDDRPIELVTQEIAIRQDPLFSDVDSAENLRRLGELRELYKEKRKEVVAVTTRKFISFFISVGVGIISAEFLTNEHYGIGITILVAYAIIIYLNTLRKTRGIVIR